MYPSPAVVDEYLNLICKKDNNIMNKHKWHDVLIAIAEGREFQIYSEHAGEWQDWNPSLKDPINYPNDKYRVKPRIVRKYAYAYKATGRSIYITEVVYTDDQHFCSVASKNNISIEWFQRLDNSCVELVES